jgi:hypothetical protein
VRRSHVAILHLFNFVEVYICDLEDQSAGDIRL